ncbi:MAG TPA: adenine deaminase [Saprospirales bacterium]|nr:adenine deaminase [Saprospirales bacterium]HAY72066.1 adenine deaminase [Saprospirales bacterium]HRQ30736.1 adenine deaminase [Saprospiraceae bacterium]
MTSYFSGNIVDVINGEIFPGTIRVENNKITRISKDDAKYDQFILPGFIDAHVHIESSMLTPSEFARVAVSHGTVATVSDAHEIANVSGIEGVRYMQRNGRTTPFKFYFSAPSCVPATGFESSGATLGPDDLALLMEDPEIKYLGEMMNFPGVIFNDPEVVKKMEIALQMGKKIDGHAPGLRGDDLKKYIGSGITTDHECFTIAEALEKISSGMKIQIREGSAVRNFDELIPLAEEFWAMCMFCSDDKHPDELVSGHINELVKRAVNLGIDIFKVLRIACINPILHYGLETGMLREGDSADFIMVENLEDFTIRKTVIGGETLFDEGKILIPYVRPEKINYFNVSRKTPADFAIKSEHSKVNIIEVIDHQLITGWGISDVLLKNGYLEADTEKDLLKIAVINRYDDLPPAIGFIKHFGLKKGAIASSVAHDSHNIIVVGTNDADMCKAVNLVVSEKGGISAVCNNAGIEEILPLPVAGLMSDREYDWVAKQYAQLDQLAKSFGSGLSAPFMTLSFMGLLVIPELKLSDKGLFDGKAFRLIGLQAI